MKTTAKADYLISEIRATVKESYSKWYVGTSERDDVWRRNDADMIVFNVHDQDATWTAFEYLVGVGMMGKKLIGKEPNYLYLYNVDGRLPERFVY